MNPYWVSPMRFDHSVGPEPDHVLTDSHAELLRRHQVAEFVQRDRHGEAHHHEGDADGESEDSHTHTLPPAPLSWPRNVRRRITGRPASGAVADDRITTSRG